MEWLRRVGVVGLASMVIAAPLTIAVGSGAAHGSDEVVTRITARSTPVVDTDGVTWAAGASMFVGARISTALVGQDVLGTSDDALYQVSAYGMASFSSRVPSPGLYRIRLLMAETYWRKPGQRVFSVAAEGQPVATDVDLVAAAGYATAHERVFDVEVQDGRLDLRFTSTVDHAVVSAIEVTRLPEPPAPTPTPTPTPTQTSGPAPGATPTSSTQPPTSGASSSTPPGDAPSVTPTGAGPTPTSPETTATNTPSATPSPSTTVPVPLADFAVRTTAQPESVQAAGHAWTSRTGLRGAARFNSTFVGQDVAGTTDDALYQVAAFDFDGFTFPVPAQGRYSVTVFMMEPYHTSNRKRVFDITAEDKTVIADIDVHKAVGRGSALRKSVIVPVRDGTLDVGFVRKIDYPIVSAIEVRYLDEHVDGPPMVVTPSSREFFVHRETARDGAVTDSAGNVWGPRSIGWGSWRRSTALDGQPIAGTDEDVLYQVNGYGITWYRLAVPAAATYRVRLLMAENYWNAPGKRVFDVLAEGEPVATGIDLVASTGGRGVAHEVAFEVPVDDGELNLSFRVSVDHALVSAIEVVSTTEVDIPSETTGSRAVTFGPTSFWTQDVSSAPAAADSTEVVAELTEQVASGPGGVAMFNAHHHNASFHVVPAGHPRSTVQYWNCQNKDGTPWGLFDGPAHFVNVPVPEDAVAAAGTDASMTVYDPAADQLWEFWQMRRNADTNEWEACWGGRLDAVSTRQGFFPMYFGVSASGTAIAGGMVTIDDVRRGEINHAIALAVLDAKKDVFSWPAQRTDGGSSATHVVMEGQRLRLDPDVDLGQYAMTPIGRMVAKAAQKYGFIVTERSGVVAIGTESGLLTAARTGTNPWDHLLAGPDYEALRNFPWDKLQALPKDWGKLS